MVRIPHVWITMSPQREHGFPFIVFLGVVLAFVQNPSQDPVRPPPLRFNQLRLFQEAPQYSPPGPSLYPCNHEQETCFRLADGRFNTGQHQTVKLR